MKKMMKRKSLAKGLGVLTAAVLLLAFTGQAGAFCVHNKSDRTVLVKQTSGGKWLKSFKAILSSGEKACCNWQNKDCNKDGEAGAAIGFNVSRGDPALAFCKHAEIRADGDLSICGNRGNFSCKPNSIDCN